MDTGSGGAPGGEQAGQTPGSEGAHAEEPVLVLRHAAKSFGAVQALVDGSIELYPGRRTPWSARTARASPRW